jgi:tetratricopeptide (TPR) repeat protein
MLAIVLTGCKQPRSDTIPLTTSSDEAKRHFIKGMEYAECAKRAAARAEFAAAASIDSDFALAYAGLAMVQSSAGDMVETATQAESMSRPSERTTTKRSGFGLHIDAFANGPSSSELVGQATRRISKVSDGERLWILSFQAQLAGDQKGQFDACSSMVALYPKDERAHRWLGDCYAGQQRFDQAIREYQQALTLRPDCPASYNMLGYYSVRTGDLAGAEHAFKRQTEILPGEANPRDSFAEFLLTQGRYAESLENYKQALKLDPGFINARVGAATNLMLLGRHDEAESFLNRPGDDSLSADMQSMLRMGLALCSYDRGDFERALSRMNELVAFTRAKQSAYETVAELFHYGMMLLERGQIAEAKRAFRDVLIESDKTGFPPEIRRRIDAQQTALNGCVCNLREGHLDAARADAQRLAGMVTGLGDPNLTSLSHICSGLVELKSNHLPEAVAELKQANPNDAYTLFVLGSAYEGSGDAAKAKECYQRVAVPRTLNNLSFFLIRPQARDALQRMEPVAAKAQASRS